jgi:hypothetical protein
MVRGLFLRWVHTPVWGGAIAETISIYGRDGHRTTVKIKAERIEIEIMMGNVPHQSKIGRRWWILVVVR